MSQEKPKNRRTFFTRSECIENLRSIKNLKATTELICRELAEGADKGDFDIKDPAFQRIYDKIRRLNYDYKKLKFRND